MRIRIIVILAKEIEYEKIMRSINEIYDAIDSDGFIDSTLQLIDEYINDIENGSTDFPRFNQQEHAGLCKGGSPLIGASIIACYATGSITASCNAEGRQGSPANWEIEAHAHCAYPTLCKLYHSNSQD